DDVRDVLAFVVDGGNDWMRRVDGGNGELGGGDDKPFVDEDLGAGWMIDDHQTELIVVVSFPKLGRDTQIVVAVARHELIASDLVPLFCRLDARGTERVDAQSNRRTPRH